MYPASGTIDRTIAGTHPILRKINKKRERDETIRKYRKGFPPKADM
jgi:hypothetical protein